MIKYFYIFYLSVLVFANTFETNAQVYPDQGYTMDIESIYSNLESVQGIKLSEDGKTLTLEDGVLQGSFILKPQSSASPFNQGLPSWNGTSPKTSSSFKVFMRFPYKGSWSPWLTVGYWKSNIWTSYGTTSYDSGYVDIDYVKLKTYVSSWQFQVVFKRNSVSQTSPTIHKLSFFVSDSRTTDNVNITQIVADKPAAVFIPTTHIYQYSVDPNIGGDICSPTSVCMILKSYDIPVDSLQFAQDTYDYYHGMFGIWPRVVQNASEYGLTGMVTRYRTWSETREILANGGRIALSLGSPLYPNGHLVMLAGFTTDGRPIVHDPARSNGYSYVFDKTSLSQSWFNKGGVSYTFYLADTSSVSDVQIADNQITDLNFELYQNYPNPFNPSTKIRWQSLTSGWQTLKVYDILGNEIATLVDEYREAGKYQIQFDAASLSSGIYIYKITFAGNSALTGKDEIYTITKKMTLLK